MLNYLRPKEKIVVKNIPLIASPWEGFKERYGDGIVIIKPETNAIYIHNVSLGLVKLKLYVKYAARRDPAPHSLEIIFDFNKSSTLIPSRNGYIRIEDYLSIKPNKILVSENQSVTVYLYINFTKELVDAVKYNILVFDRKDMPIIDIHAYTPANNAIESKPYKYIYIYSVGIRVRP